MFGNVNSNVGLILSLRPDVILVYGTGKLDPPIVRAAPHVLNFHGGDPGTHRGLDSHLWALDQHDPLGLQVTLHYVDDSLDTGDIVFQHQLDLTGVSSLAGLQRRTMETCVELARLALNGIERGFLPRRTQRAPGRYYSLFPDKQRGRCETYLRSLAS